MSSYLISEFFGYEEIFIRFLPRELPALIQIILGLKMIVVIVADLTAEMALRLLSGGIARFVVRGDVTAGFRTFDGY